MAINCYLIDVVKNESGKSLSYYKNMGLAGMEQKIKNGYHKSALLLSGYNRPIRNSIAHNNMNYWSYGTKIVFVDNYKGKMNEITLSDEKFRQLIYLIFLPFFSPSTSRQRCLPFEVFYLSKILNF